MKNPASKVSKESLNILSEEGVYLYSLSPKALVSSSELRRVPFSIIRSKVEPQASIVREWFQRTLNWKITSY